MIDDPILFQPIKIDPQRDPDHEFPPSSNPDIKIYSKLAERANSNARWAIFWTLITVGSIASYAWTSGGTIYSCFETVEGSNPPLYKQIDINICKEANGGKLSVPLSLRSNNPYLWLACCGLGALIGLFWIKEHSVMAIRLLAYGVKATNGSDSLEIILAGLFGGLICQSIYFQSLIPLVEQENHKLYYWKSDTYPETFMGHTWEFINGMGVLLVMIKIMLVSRADPIGYFCSLSELVNLGSSWNLGMNLIGRVDCNQFLLRWKEQLYQNRELKDNDVNLWNFIIECRKHGLLYDIEEEQPEDEGVIKKIQEKIIHYIGWNSFGFERKARDLISKPPLTITEGNKKLRDEYNELLTAYRNLLYHLLTKRWFRIYLFCAWFVFDMNLLALYYGTQTFIGERIWKSLILFLGILLGFIPRFLEKKKGYAFALSFLGNFLRLIGNCLIAVNLTIGMLQVKDGEHIYLPSPYLVIFICLLLLICSIKIWAIKYLINQVRTRLLDHIKSPDKPPDICSHLSSHLLNNQDE